MSHSTHKMLIEFDAAIDMEIGFANYVYTLTNDPSNGSIFNISFLRKDLNTLRHERYNDPDFLCKIFRDNISYETARSIYEDTLKTDFEGVAILAPNVLITERLINIFHRVGTKNIARCDLLASKPEEIAVLKKHYPRSTVIDGSGKAKIDFNQYARIIIADGNNAAKYASAQFKHIALLSYPRNFEVINGVKIVNKNALAILGHTNQIELISPY